MRNVFDQYSEPENRVTHALACCLSEDSRLLRAFVRWATHRPVPRGHALEIVEQRLPGEPEIPEKEAERRGLPDIWIHDGGRWAVLIESKISSPLRIEQLRRHYRTAVRRGFEDITVLALDVEASNKTLPKWAHLLKWSDIYKWLSANAGKSDWAVQTAGYLEIAEAKLSEDGYLKQGTLTVFSGVPFNENEPYNYGEAKRLLKLAMNELRRNKELIHELKMNPKGAGRGAITGKLDVSVWDYLRVKEAGNIKEFTKYPHLTLALQHDRIVASVTVPHQIMTEYRRNLVGLGFDGFSELMASVNKNLVRRTRKANGAVPWVVTVQRRYPAQRSTAFVDASLQYDLRTAFSMKGKGNRVKVQPEWLIATYEALAHKRSNLQVAVGSVFPYRNCAMVRRPEILDCVAGSWLACKPLLNVMLGRRVRKT